MILPEDFYEWQITTGYINRLTAVLGGNKTYLEMWKSKEKNPVIKKDLEKLKKDNTEIERRLQIFKEKENDLLRKYFGEQAIEK